MTDILIKLLKILNKQNPIKILSIFSISFLLYIIILKQIAGQDFELFFSDNFFVLLIIFTLVFIAIGAIKYLDSATNENDNFDQKSSLDIERLVDFHIKRVIKEIQRHTTSTISQEEKENLLNDLRSQFETKISEEYYKEIQQRIKNEWLENEIDLSIKFTTRRLYDEIKTLKLRSNLNLVIGMILCFSGIIVLYLFLQKNAVIFALAFKNHNINEIILTLLPNGFFVLLIEIFSYFFLNLYKKRALLHKGLKG